MNDGLHLTPVNAEVVDKRVVETIAHETGTPVDLADRIYREELRALIRDARITQFANVIATRKARLRLRRLS